jgi:hypothetical protein
MNYGEMHRFLPAIASEQTSNIGEMVVNHRAQLTATRSGDRTDRAVILDLLTVRFLLSYSTQRCNLRLIGIAMGLLAR